MTEKETRGCHICKKSKENRKSEDDEECTLKMFIECQVGEDSTGRLCEPIEESHANLREPIKESKVLSLF